MIDTIYLHVGPHKTGSTTIQESLGKNRELLLKHGYLYPYFEANDRIVFNHSVFLKIRFHFRMEESDLAFRDLIESTFDQQKWMLAFDEQLLFQLNQFQGKYLILSGESMCAFSELHFAQLKNYLIDVTHKNVKFKVIILTRNSVDLFQSHAIELIKNGNTLHYSIEKIRRIYKKLYQNLFVTLSKFFNKSDIIVYRFEDSIRHPGGPAAFFLQMLEVDDQILSYFINEQYNAAMSYEALTILSAINEKMPKIGGLLNIKSVTARNQLFHLTGQKYVFNQDFQKEIWAFSKQDINGFCDAFSLPNYEYKEKPESSLNNRWSQVTLNHLFCIFVAAEQEIKQIILDAVMREYKENYDQLTKSKKDEILSFIVRSSHYIPTSVMIRSYYFLVRGIGYFQGILALTTYLLDHMLWLKLKKRRIFSVNLLTLSEENTPRHDIEDASYENSHLSFIAKGQDPWFVIENPFPNTIIQLLSIDLSVPENTTCQIFFMNDTNEVFSESKSLRYFATQGKNRAFFKFSTLEKIVKIRIDPGQVAGEYCLHSIKLETLQN